MDVARELYLEHGWKMPNGLKKGQQPDPNNFTLAQWQQAKRLKKDPKLIKQTLRECWQSSDNKDSFVNALKDQGYVIAKGDRRGFVVVDQMCEIYTLSRWAGVKAKELKSRMGKYNNLPSVSEAREQIARDMAQRLTKLKDQEQRELQIKIKSYNHQKKARFRKGLKGIMDRVTGKYRQIQKQNERETWLNYKRDQQEKDQMIFMHLEEKQKLKTGFNNLEDTVHDCERTLKQDIQKYREIINYKEKSLIQTKRGINGPLII